MSAVEINNNITKNLTPEVKIPEFNYISQTFNNAGNVYIFVKNRYHVSFSRDGSISTLPANYDKELC